MQSPPTSPRSPAAHPSTPERRSAQQALGSAPTATRNPISLRLYKVLGTTFHDPSAREALDTLSSFYSPTVPTPYTGQINGTIKSSVEETITVPADDESPGELPWAAAKANHLKEGVRISGDIAEHARKNLRRDTESKLADGSLKFLKAFGDVDQKLDALQELVQDMQTQCDEAQSKLQSTNEACTHLLERAGGLRTQRQNTALRQSVITLFLSRFTLTETETEAITSREIAVDPKLFQAMDRIEKIRVDCTVLLSGEGGGTKAGVDIMSLTSSLLDQAYQRLIRLCSYEFRQIAKESHAEVGVIMREAVRRLRQRPSLLTESLNTLSMHRKSYILSSFLHALTKGHPRPIELHAHDPIRYIGDMLAWVHQAMAGEREFLEGLFGVVDEGRMVGSIRKLKRGSEVEDWMAQLMDEDLEKICMPLRVRVLQTIKSQEGSLTTYKIANLLQFYTVTMQRTIGEQALLSRTLRELTDVAYNVFFDTLEAQGRSLLRFLHPPDADLSPPLTLRDAAQVLREIMDVFDSSLLDDSPSTSPDDVEAFAKILDATLDPMLEMSRRMIELKKDATEWNKAVFLINCEVYLQGILQPHSFTHSRIEVLDGLINEQIQILIAEHYSLLSKESGLAPLRQAIESTSDATPLSHIPTASSAALSTALQTFDAFLSNLSILSHPRLALLTHPRISTIIHRSSLRKLGLAYGTMCEAVRKPENRYEFAGTVLGSRRPFGQMAVLWQVLGVDENDEEGKYTVEI